MQFFQSIIPKFSFHLGTKKENGKRNRDGRTERAAVAEQQSHWNFSLHYMSGFPDRGQCIIIEYGMTIYSDGVVQWNI